MGSFFICIMHVQNVERNLNTRLTCWTWQESNLVNVLTVSWKVLFIKEGPNTPDSLEYEEVDE